jgi:hypothetical protein
MTKRRFTPWVALACIGTVAACTSGDGGTAGNTELNVVIPNGADNGSSAPGVVDIQTVEYTIKCNGNNDTFLNNGASFADAVTLNGNLEVNEADPVEAPGINPSTADVFQGFMDLPPGNCSAEFRARDNDGEVICSDRVGFTVTADDTFQVNLVMYCGLSFQAPVGMADLSGTFSFNVANFCPDLIVLNCLESFPQEPTDETGASTGPATTECEVRLRDGDHTCGTACDPQECEADGESGLICTQPGGPILPSGFDPGADPGTTTTVNCAGASMDCNLNGTFGQTTCTYTGDQLGTLAVNDGIVPNPPAAFGVTCQGQLAGAPVTCTAVTTDGDDDCNKTKVVTYECPGLNFCDTTAGACEDNNECTDNDCDRNAQACANTPVLPGGGDNCTTGSGGIGECDGSGFCAPFGCDDTGADPDIDCFGGDDCNLAETCSPPDCVGGGTTNPGGLCDDGSGADTGLCEAGTCITTVCRIASQDVDCAETPPNDCTTDTCDETTTAGECLHTEIPGGECTVDGNPGTCTSDGTAECELDPFIPAAITRAVPLACSNNLAPQLSDLLFDMTITAIATGPSTNGIPLADTDFDVEVTAILQFDQAFLQASIGFVPGLLVADVVGARGSVGARGAVVDPLVPGDNTVGNQQNVTPAPGSNCTIWGSSCVGGSNDGNGCNTDTQCPSGLCTGPELAPPDDKNGNTFCNLPIPQIPNPGFPGTGQPCAADEQCVFFLLGSTCASNACTAASNPLPCDPTLCTSAGLDNGEFCSQDVDCDVTDVDDGLGTCSSNSETSGYPEDCPLFGVPSAYHPEVEGTGGQQCVANVASPTGFLCENFACTGPGDATTPPAIIAPGAECFASSDCQGANYGETCDSTTFECNGLDCSDGTCNVCTNLVVSGLAVPIGPFPSAQTYTAGSTAGEQFCFDYSGDATVAGGANLNLINVNAGGIAVALSCQGGTVIDTCPDTCPVEQSNIIPNTEDPTVLPCFLVQ